VSFGGESGVELADSCSNLSQLTAAYQSVINTLHVSHIDFDIEGAEIAYTAQNNLRFQAINALEAANPGLVVSVTIPVNPNGPDANGQAFLQEAKANGTRIDIINVMTMDYYGSWDTGGANMGAYSVEAAQDTLGYAQTLWPSMTYANIGVTPMIGQNDDPAEVFTEANAQTLVSFAAQNHLGRLAFWSVDRDQACGGSASGLPQCSEISQQPLDFTHTSVLMNSKNLVARTMEYGVGPAGGQCRGEGLVPGCGQLLDHLRADQPGTADDCELHVSFLFSAATPGRARRRASQR
jgi:Glycosyl hydrolases family 18